MASRLVDHPGHKIFGSNENVCLIGHDMTSECNAWPMKRNAIFYGYICVNNMEWYMHILRIYMCQLHEMVLCDDVEILNKWYMCL